MNKRVSWTFLAVSVVFFLFIVGLTGYRLEDVRTRNALQARGRFEDLAAKVSSIRGTYVSLGSPSASRELHAAFDAEPRLLLLCVHSSATGIEYVLARSQSYLKEPANPNPQWRGTPQYDVSRGYEIVLSRPLGSDASGPVLDGLFVIMGREDLYPIVRDDLYLFLAFLLVSAVVILIVMSVQDEPASSSPAGGRGKPRPASEGPRGFTSPTTGLVWGEHVESRLQQELDEAVGSGRDLALARLRLDDPYADSQLPAVYPAIARLLQKAFPARDCVFDTGIDSFAVVLPGAGIDAAVKSLEIFRKAVTAREIEGRTRSLSIGVTSRAGRQVTASTLLEEANVSLSKASREGGNQVIGFRADPSRFHKDLSPAV